jgi:hypothetical protein
MAERLTPSHEGLNSTELVNWLVPLLLCSPVKSTDISEENIVSIFRAEKMAEQKTVRKNSYSLHKYQLII